MGMKIIGLLGSPLVKGNTAKLLDQALRGATDAGCEVEKIIVPFLDFNPCMEIMYCREHETCKMKDDMIPIYEKFKEADSVVVATPVMSMGIPGKLKGFIDRFQVFFMAKYVRNKPLVDTEKKKHRRGLYIGISGMNLPDIFDGAKMTIQAFFRITDFKYWDELLIRDMDTIQDISTRPELVEMAYKKGYELGRLLVEENEAGSKPS
jgi:putative NADPH-quinone reductase